MIPKFIKVVGKKWSGVENKYTYAIDAVYPVSELSRTFIDSGGNNIAFGKAVIIGVSKEEYRRIEAILTESETPKEELLERIKVLEEVVSKMSNDDNSSPILQLEI